MYNLLSVNAKLEKGKDFGILNLGLQLAPSDTSGFNTCPTASPGCRASCIFTSGNAQIFKHINEARIRKTRMYFEQRAEFMALLRADIRKGMRQAEKLGMKLVIRLNVFSDIPWEETGIMGEFPTVQFMDYTAIPKRFFKTLPPNYHLTFSRKENNDAAVQKVLKAGGNVAVAFSGPLPATWNGYKVIDGDLHDNRWQDEKNIIVGLKAKGKGRKDQSGFIIHQ